MCDAGDGVSSLASDRLDQKWSRTSEFLLESFTEFAPKQIPGREVSQPCEEEITCVDQCRCFPSANVQRVRDDVVCQHSRLSILRECEDRRLVDQQNIFGALHA